MFFTWRGGFLSDKAILLGCYGFLLLGHFLLRVFWICVEKSKRILTPDKISDYISLVLLNALWRKWLQREHGFPAVTRRSGTEARNQRKLPEFDSRQGTNFFEESS